VWFTNICVYVDVYNMMVSKIVHFQFVVDGGGVVDPEMLLHQQCNVFRVVTCALHIWTVIISTNVRNIEIW
jgi:hypothetical protein